MTGNQIRLDRRLICPPDRRQREEFPQVGVRRRFLTEIFSTKEQQEGASGADDAARWGAGPTAGCDGGVFRERRSAAASRGSVINRDRSERQLKGSRRNSAASLANDQLAGWIPPESPPTFDLWVLGDFHSECHMESRYSHQEPSENRNRLLPW